MSKIKLGIIGTGRMGITHYSIINSHPKVKVIAIADPSSLVKTMMSKYLPIRSFKDYNALFENVDLDAILVCTPPNLNFTILEKSAAKNIHAFVEKPFTTNYLEALKLIKIYKEKELVNQVAM